MSKKIPITLFLITIWVLSPAQIIHTGTVFTGGGNQEAQQCYVDNIGNRYQIIVYNTSFTIDSVGTPVAIKRSTTRFLGNISNSTAVVKFDSSGRYKHHIKLESFSHLREGISLAFAGNNDIYIKYNFAQFDTLTLTDKSGVEKNIVPQYNQTSIDNNHYGQVICRFTSSGELSWANSITQQNITSPNISYSFTDYLTVNSNDQVSCYFAMDNQSGSDTLCITNLDNVKTNHIVTSKDPIFNFDGNGQPLSIFEPFKNRFLVSTNTLSTRDAQVVILDDCKYLLMAVSLSSTDTFRCATPFVLVAGEHYILIKSNPNDSILWAKPIRRKTTGTNLLSEIHIIGDIRKKEIILCTNYDNDEYELTLNPSYFNTQKGTYLCKLDTEGNIVWEDFWPSTRILCVEPIYLFNQLLIVGHSIGSNPKISTYLPSNTSSANIIFTASLDSNRNVIIAQPIINTPVLSQTIRLGFHKLGYPITDMSGHAYISGWFADSINLPCKTLNAAVEFNSFGNPLYDGFVLKTQPWIPIDTNVCKNLQSPSNKYTWDSTGYYFDTIPNAVGCDSILWFRLKVLNSKSYQDSAVCHSMISYSGKYVWDTTGNYTDTIPNTNGCDSVINLHLIILQTQNTIDSTVDIRLLSPSGKYNWDSSGIYKDTLTNANGCDSILTIRLKVLQTKSTIDTAVCKSLLSPSGKYTFTQPGIYNDTLTNIAGSDSIITIHLTLLQTYNHIDTTYCSTYPSPSGLYFWTTSGVYSDTLINSHGCDSIIFFQLTIQPVNIEVTKTNDITCISPTANLNATDGFSYEWSPSDGLSAVNIANPTATPTKSTMYYVTATNNIGCMDSDSIEVNVTKIDSIVSLPNVFTPNNDGYNDCFELNSIVSFSNYELIIYSRWGNIVFETTDPAYCWDGKSLKDQKELAEGVYYYILKATTICGNNIDQNGSITILR